MKLDKKKVVLKKESNDFLEKPIALSKKDRLLFVWDLTMEIYSLAGEFDVKSRLQRDVITVIRQ